MTVVKADSRDIMGPAIEQDLMHRIAKGDRDAFRRVMGVYMTDIYRFAYSIIGDATRAEDITQEAFLRLWTKAESWNPSGRVKSWLFRITHNLCIDDIRGRKNYLPLEKFSFTLPDQGQSPAENLSDAQMSHTVRTALFTLPERQRTALMLVHYAGHSNAECGQIMDLSVDAVESLLSRGRRKLKELLSDTGKALREG